MSEFYKRSITGVCIVVIISVAVYFGDCTFFLLCTAIGFSGLWEFYRLFGVIRPVRRIIPSFMLAASLFASVWSVMNSSFGVEIFLINVPIVSFILVTSLYIKSENPFNDIAVIFLGQIYVTLGVILFYSCSFETTLFVMIGLVLTSCTVESPTASLKNDETRRALYAEILDNHHYLKELMDSMRTSEHARMMMHSDTAMTNKFVHDMPAQKMVEHLMAKVEEDSTTCKMMCSAMMDHKKVMETMLESLDKGGVVDKSCMMKKKDVKVKGTHQH